MTGLSERDAAKLRTARLAAARRSPNLEEIPDDLVRRARRWVSASSDHVYREARGKVFGTGGADLIIAPYERLYFVVTEDGTLRFYEREPATWSEQLARRLRPRRKRVRT